MSAINTEDTIHGKAQLVNYLEEGCTAPARWRVGVEYERLVCRRDDLCPAPYHGPQGIEELLRRLCEFGWQRDTADQPLIGLHRGEEKVSLEPGGQLEHADAPVANVHRVLQSITRHQQEIAAIAHALNLRVLGIGFEPLYPAQINNWIPQERFLIMRAYMPKVGRHGLDMMQRSASIQVNLDYSTEADMVRKFRVALALQPLCIALFANSPVAESADTGLFSYRSFVWRHTDTLRCGIPEFIFEDGMGFERYVDWALDVPMYSVMRGGHHIDTAGRSFRDFLNLGLPELPGQRPLLCDWSKHLQTLSPEVRLK